jgi:hypothetical protein
MAMRRRRGIMTSEDGARLRRIKGARHAHAVIRASGRVPGEEARAKVAENRALRKRREQLQAMYATDWNKGQADLSGI